MNTITLKRKDGTEFTGTVLECARKMQPDAERFRIADEDFGMFSPIPPHWIFEDFCTRHNISFKWYPTNHNERGFYVLSQSDPNSPASPTD